ncbi:hypothetical protein [Candidatus Parabeggiatoa sp. HSG14]|uniref:hypothetical protein n=1 Tax=Candidatus Parabeggiatoa sp. HSG14 TaxID=3055593 RepID=UPI0025A8E952|nr:hypothetical protein [Thiotrichales bacterium HSG14]
MKFSARVSPQFNGSEACRVSLANHWLFVQMLEWRSFRQRTKPPRLLYRESLDILRKYPHFFFFPLVILIV